jgi:hypothetical protein
LDAAITDPAYDFGLLLRDLGPPPPSTPPCATIRPTARRCANAPCSTPGGAVLEDLAYGLETGRRRYVEQSLAALDRLLA